MTDLDEFVHPAPWVIQKSETAAIEDLEEFIPIDRF